MTHSARGSRERRDGHTDAAPSPWAPGGAMSDPAKVAEPIHPGVGGSDGARAVVTPRLRPRRCVAMTAAALITAAGILVWTAGDRTTDSDPNRESTTEGSSAPPSDSIAERPVIADSTGSPIGVIRWTRVSGDQSTLPAAVVRQTNSGLVGRGEGGDQTWTSDDGSAWQFSDEAATTEVGNRQWSVVRDDDRRRLVEVTDAGRAQTPIAARATARDGIDVSWEVPDGQLSVVEINGDLFARLDRREDVPWRNVLGIGAGESYRVRITDGIHRVLAESSEDQTTPTIEFIARREADRVVLEDLAGAVVWSVAASPTASALDAVATQVSAEWLRWNGRQLESIDRPWASKDGVGVVLLDDVLIAVATISRDSGARVWLSTDGLYWSPVELPAQPSPASPISLTTSVGQITLTISDGGTTSHWSTADAMTFDRLVDVPGINQRSRGTFGWLAPDPRSSPRLRVSADGAAWDVVDLSKQLGFDSSRWDTDIDAITIGSNIYVVATRGDERTLLVGTVEQN
jgi:hypothetical protein